MNQSPLLITTEDGSHSLLNPLLNETYHSIHGAVQESEYVFIEQGLKFWFGADESKDSVAVLEIGFGTGLNALLSFGYSQAARKHIEYTSVESYPLPEEIWRQLNYSDRLGLQAVFHSLHELPWNVSTRVEELFSLQKLHTTLELLDVQDGKYDVVFYDAFAPSKQPEMWTMDMIAKSVKGLSKGGVFVTYCAKGQLKRDLRELGLVVQTLPGPPGKKEMVRAVK